MYNLYAPASPLYSFFPIVYLILLMQYFKKDTSFFISYLFRFLVLLMWSALQKLLSPKFTIRFNVSKIDLFARLTF